MAGRFNHNGLTRAEFPERLHTERAMLQGPCVRHPQPREGVRQAVDGGGRSGRCLRQGLFEEEEDVVVPCGLNGVNGSSGPTARHGL